MKKIENHQNRLSEESFQFLTDLLSSRGPSGFESALQKVFLAYVQKFADRVASDAYGNVWAEVGDSAKPCVVITGHGDEIGLMVNRIEKEGFVRVTAIGGVDPATLVSRRVYVETAKGLLSGVVGALPIHLQDRDNRKVPKMWELFLDLGLTSAEDVAAAGVKIGSWATLVEDWMLLPGNRIVSRALDNRIGVFAAAETLRIVKEAGCGAYRVVAVSTVQEEIGAIGAEMITRSLQPSGAFVVDVTHATDIPGCDRNRFGEVEMDKGPTMTHGSANHPRLVQLLERTAANQDIAVQWEASSRYTGTDADSIYRRLGGVPSALVLLPNRYMHTTAETSSLNDLEQIPRLLAAACAALDASDLQNLIG